MKGHTNKIADRPTFYWGTCQMFYTKRSKYALQFRKLGISHLNHTAKEYEIKIVLKITKW